ncbi:hypothetical protein J7L18_03185 [Candidatus Bathyarchaeota archaeon]|nr:hypothetical protein [Candidatus Bathyarchaeota archaeon]
MSKIEDAIREIETCEEIARRYEHTRRGARALETLRRMKNLLKNPTKENIDQCISMIEMGEEALSSHKYMSVIDEFLNHLSKAKECLRKAAEKT